MGRRTIETGPVVAAVGAALLAVSLFLEWFRAEREESGLSGWTSFEVLDLVLAALALAALAAALEKMGYRTPGPGPRSLTLLGLIALILVGSQLVNHPPAGLDRAAEVGAWLALGASGLILAGGLIGRARISFEIVSDRPVADQPPAAAPSAGEPTTPLGDEDETRRVR